MMASSTNAMIYSGNKSSVRCLSFRNDPHLDATEVEEEVYSRSVPMIKGQPMDTFSYFASGTMPTLYTNGSPIACDDEFVSQFDEPIRLQSNLIDSDECKSSEPRKVLCTWAKGFLATSPSIAIAQSKSSEDTGHASLKSLSIGHSMERDTMPTEVEEYMGDGMAFLQSSLEEYEDLNVCFDQASALRASLCRPVVSLMVCNLPCNIYGEGLAQIIEELGFAGLYVYAFVPRGKKNAKGYGFVEFVSSSVASRFAEVIGTYTFPDSDKRPFCKAAACPYSKKIPRAWKRNFRKAPAGRRPLYP